MSEVELETLLAVEVLDREGTERKLAELVGGAPALLVFLRHFG